ncbi:MAG: hypothetical protein ACTSQC_06325 [Candidatus Heimdallarchaeaceae archaeon]
MRSDEKEELTIKEKIKIFSKLYLAHHEICEECKNHVFKIGPLYLCVGCTIFGIILFSFLDVFKGFPLVVALITSYGVFMALMQLFLKPTNKLLKTLMRFSLGLGMGSFFALLVFIPNWYLKFGLFILLGIGTILYNIVRSYSHMDDCVQSEPDKIDTDLK